MVAVDLVALHKPGHVLTLQLDYSHQNLLSVDSYGWCRKHQTEMLMTSSQTIQPMVVTGELGALHTGQRAK